MKIVTRFFFPMILFFIVLPCLAQQPEMADQMRSDGKIYVVIAIVLAVLIGLIGYLLILDRKVSRLEQTKNKT